MKTIPASKATPPHPTVAALRTQTANSVIASLTSIARQDPGVAAPLNTIIGIVQKGLNSDRAYAAKVAARATAKPNK